MSTESYAKWWIKTKKGLENVREYDEAMKKMESVKDRSIASRLIGGLYARYCMIIQDIDACLDQMCQVQKSFTIRKLMDAAATRLNELKDEMTKIDLSEYHYIDGALVELKVIPHSVEILHPAIMFPRMGNIEDIIIKFRKGDIVESPSRVKKKPSAIDNLVASGKASLHAMQSQSNVTGSNQNINASPSKKSLKAKSIVRMNASKAGLKGAASKGKVDGRASKADINKKQSRVQIMETPAQDAQTQKDEKEIKPDEQKKKRKRTRPKTYMLDTPVLTDEEAEAKRRKDEMISFLKVIQTHERGRQARLYYTDLEQANKARKTTTSNKGGGSDQDDKDIKEKAATKIQATWRGYKVRSYLKKRELEKRLLIGMDESSWKSKEEFQKFRSNLEKRRAIRDKNFRDYLQANIDEKDRVLRVIGPGLFEDIGDEIREWFRDWYDGAKTFMEIPGEEKGGSILIVRGETLTPAEFLIDQEMKKKSKKKAKTKEQIAKEKKAAKEKLKKEAKAKKEKERAERRKRAKEFEIKFDEPTVAVQKFKTGFDEYREIWDPINDADNPLDKHYMHMITDEKCYEMQLEVREQVDILMRIELEILDEALQKDKWLKKKKRKGKFKPKKKKKKKKKGKKKRGKKDPTASRTAEDLFQELVDYGIIRNYPPVRISDFKGDFSYQNCEKRELTFDPPPTLGDVRQAVTLNCIMPLGVETLNKPKSVLIAGPRKSGKHLLANAIFNETQCVLFDLSPTVIAGKYEGKKETQMLIHLITKMSRMLQPSIIYIDGAEKNFYKKIPKNEKELDPRRVGKFLLKKIIKPITPDDRVLVLGITGQPWAAKANGIKKAYQRVILIPPTDYGSVFLYWREILMPYHGVDRSINLSAISKLTEKYPLVELNKAVKEALYPKRIVQLSYQPLQQSELLAPLLEGPGPLTDKELQKFQKWYTKTVLGKQRNKLNKFNEVMREKLAKANEKKNKKKK
ncbi:PREDICTED: IQ and AAA domain-containing protein 1-like [Nicrophorus vespilloides]|uniref:IQ and AAA domain-containing protein 1-like n=1 Tax=Nicrophorus vespilloides TaxID=110193 RepID=A0ABM1M7J6_NICVS|nr:PREDICTED: IQ and AAA domain-containing protein 1-like [Nicrophorus vespilloides]